MKTAKDIYEEIKSEDELPSEAGLFFRHLLGYAYDVKGGLLGYRELGLIANWIDDYLSLRDKTPLHNLLEDE